MFTSLRRLLAVGTAAAVASIGLVAAPPAVAKAPSPTTRASSWLASHQPTEDDGYAGRITSAMGLAVANTNATASTLRDRVTALRDDAAAHATTVGVALKLAILVEVMRLNPRDFGGVNLVQTIRAGIQANGQVGDFASAYSQALAIIALKRAKEPVPSTVVTTLLSFQDPASGAFGYEWPAGTFNADPDSTALAIQALDLIGRHRSAVNKAVSWAKKNQTKAGYWEAYSPVDSTALMATALKQADRGYGKARTWLLSQQLSDGGFPAERDGSSSDLLATADATYLLVGKSMAKVSYTLRGYTKSPRPKVTGVRRVGETLTADARTWAPVPSFAYQWYRSGRKITGATAASYTLIGKDLGKKIRVRVKAYGIGLKSHYEYSTYTGKVKKALAG